MYWTQMVRLMLCVPSFAVMIAQPSLFPLIGKVVVDATCVTLEGTSAIAGLLLVSDQTARLMVRSFVPLRLTVLVSVASDVEGHGTFWFGTLNPNAVVPGAACTTIRSDRVAPPYVALITAHPGPTPVTETTAEPFDVSFDAGTVATAGLVLENEMLGMPVPFDSVTVAVPEVVPPAVIE
jgi:hypothetical protein